MADIIFAIIALGLAWYSGLQFYTLLRMDPLDIVAWLTTLFTLLRFVGAVSIAVYLLVF